MRKKEYVIDGEPVVSRRPAKLPPQKARRIRPHMVNVCWAYDHEGSKRLPTVLEWERINSCETALVLAAERLDVSFVGTLTSDGLHQFIVYCADPIPIQIALIDSLPMPLKIPVSAELWNVGTTHDPDWKMAELL